LRSGVFSRSFQQMQWSRISQIAMAQGFIERLRGLGRLSIVDIGGSTLNTGPLRDPMSAVAWLQAGRARRAPGGTGLGDTVLREPTRP
jgi:uncharacterized membrane protein YdbT with pleckstrin-like domain